MPLPDGARVAITIGLTDPAESIWLNGIKQNAVYLAQTLAASKRGLRVCLANTTEVSVVESPVWALADLPVRPLAAIESELDVLIVLGGAVDQARCDRLRRAGTRVIAYKCGAEYVLSMQAAIFGRAIPGDALFLQGLDGLWLVPQIADAQRGFYETLHRGRAQTVPFVWDPVLLERECAALPNQGRYQPGRVAKRLSCFEPNHDVVKYCLYPMLIAEQVFRERPELIELMSVTNTETLRAAPEFVNVVGHLELVRQKRCFFENRFVTAWFLAHHTDVVIAHQWENPLNYAYLEAAWLGYPLIHNAALCADIGYFYPGFDVALGAAALRSALERHDVRDAAYRSTQHERLDRFRATNPANVATYEQLLDRAWAR